MLYGRRLFTFFLTQLSLLLLPVSAVLAGGHEPTAQQARLDASMRLDQTIALRGEWGLAWQRFVDPAWEQLPAQAFTVAPASWNDVGAPGKPPGPNGWGSYMLRFDCPAGHSMAVEASHQRTASRLLVNGELVAAQGEPGTTAQTSHATLHARTPISREFACPLRITLQLSNFDHRVGGFVRPLRAGPADLLVRQRESRVIYEAGLLAAHLLTAVLAFIFYVVHRRGHAGSQVLLAGMLAVLVTSVVDLLLLGPNEPAPKLAPMHVRGEELLCYFIVANLVKNALEASRPGDRVDVRLTPGDPVTLTIHNPGEVPPDIAGRFFDKYVTCGKRGVTGLGTYSARLMARAQRAAGSTTS